jgi:hypothetical protein
MEKISIKLIFIGGMLSLFTTGKLVAQTTVRMFYFAPTNIIIPNFTGSSAYIYVDSCANQPTGYSYVLLDSRTVGAFRRIAPPRIKATFDSLTNTGSTLRREIRKLNTLSHGMITRTEISLFDDRTGLNACDTCRGFNPGNGPRALEIQGGVGSNVGVLFMGELGAEKIISDSQSNYWAWDKAVIHFFSLTQFAAENGSYTKWGPGKHVYSFGGDLNDWNQELLADQQVPVYFGLSSFWSLYRNAADKDSLIRFLNNAGYRFWLGNLSYLNGIREMWDSPHQVIGTVPIPDPDGNKQRIVHITLPGGSAEEVRLQWPGIRTGEEYQLRSYKWLDVPGNYVFYNVYMFEGFMLMFHEYAFNNRIVAFNMIFNAASAMTPFDQRLRYPAFVANQLATSMESYARTDAGRREQSAGTLTSSMFVYALYDIMTHFGMSEENMRTEILRNGDYIPLNPQPLALANYWALREAVRQLACPYLGGNLCQSGSTGTIDIRRAVEVVRDYFRNDSRILR